MMQLRRAMIFPDAVNSIVNHRIYNAITWLSTVKIGVSFKDGGAYVSFFHSNASWDKSIFQRILSLSFIAQLKAEVLLSISFNLVAK